MLAQIIPMRLLYCHPSHQVGAQINATFDRKRFQPSYLSPCKRQHRLSKHALSGCRRCTHTAVQAVSESAVATCATGAGRRSDEVPAFVPPQWTEIRELAALSMLRSMQRCPTAVPAMDGRVVQTAYVGPHLADDPPSRPDDQHPPFVLIPSFDGSLLEFRRLYPLLSAARETWTLDLAGWGFTDCGFAEDPTQELGPEQKRSHLLAFWQEKIRRPMVLLGTSLGGSIAMDFALAHPEGVARLVLVDAQGFIDGIGNMATMPRLVSWLGVQVLRTKALRQMANKMAYYDKATLATEDAMLCGRLHTHLPGWADANVAFMRSGGYSLSRRIQDISQPTLVLWGENDEILDPANAQHFGQELPKSRIVMIPECGHCAHLEKPQAMASAILDFLET